MFLKELRRKLNCVDSFDAIVDRKMMNDSIRSLCLLEPAKSQRDLIGAVSDSSLGSMSSTTVRAATLGCLIHSYLLLLGLRSDVPPLPHKSRSNHVQRAYSRTKLGAEVRNAHRDGRPLQVKLPTSIEPSRLHKLSGTHSLDLEAPDKPESLADPKRIARTILAKLTSLDQSDNAPTDPFRDLEQIWTPRFQNTGRRPYAVFNWDDLLKKNGGVLPPEVEVALAEFRDQLDATCRQRSVDGLDFQFQEYCEGAETQSFEHLVFADLTELVGLFRP
jgi:hypothetical protein